MEREREREREWRDLMDVGSELREMNEGKRARGEIE